ncbi:MAG: hypothetical protein ACRD5E_02250 [Nitrososphaeraceae archaeon]
MTDKQISIREVPSAVLQEEIPQGEKPQEVEQAQEKPRISKRKQKRRITSYLSSISKQVEKQGNQINKLTIMIQSLQKYKQTKLATEARVSGSQSQSIKEIQSQISQLQKHVTRIQNDIYKMRISSVARARTKIQFRKLASDATVKTRSKKSKLSKSKVKVRKARSHKRK